MLENIISDYIAPIIMIVGLIEFTRKAVDKKKLTFYMMLQIVFCFIAGLLIVLGNWADEFTAGLVVAVAYKWLMLVSLSTLFYQLIVKKIRDAGGQVRGE